MPPPQFSITSGPFNRQARRLRLADDAGNLSAWRFGAIAWLPLLLDSLVRVAIGARVDPIVQDISVHARFLVSLPVLVVAERLLRTQCQAAVTMLYTGNVIDRGELEHMVDRASALRDNPWFEMLFAAIAVFGGQAVLWGISGPTGVFHGIEAADSSFLRIWYAAFALPLLQFLGLRWLWRWLIWTTMLVRLVRIPMATIATHPDRAAGLRFLSAPTTAFAMFELGFASILAGAWGTQLIDGRVTVPALFPTFIAFLAVSLVVAFAPLLLFTPRLFRAQRKTLLVYHPFALDYVRRFHRKWIEGSDEDVLGSPDIQSLADLDNSYQIIQQTGMFVFGSRKLVELWLAAIVPLLPLVLTVVPVEQLMRRIASAAFGGLL
jgi:hypothetical protein